MMCFSFVASVSSSGVLFLVGTAGFLLNSKWFAHILLLGCRSQSIDDQLAALVIDNRFWFLFLLTPILFATQQLCEGFVWLRVDNTSNPALAAFIFSFFAFCFWPLWVPLICLVLECRTLKKSPHLELGGPRLAILFLTMILGTLLFCYMISSLCLGRLSVHNHSNHIEYNFKSLPFKNKTPWFITIPYLLCTVAPFLLVRGTAFTWVLSFTVGIAAILSYVFYSAGTFPSTWCFFAAWLSSIVVFVKSYDLYRQSQLLQGAAAVATTDDGANDDEIESRLSQPSLNDKETPSDVPNSSSMSAVNISLHHCSLTPD